MSITLLENTYISGVLRSKGDTLDLNDDLEYVLVSSNKAEWAYEPIKSYLNDNLPGGSKADKALQMLGTEYLLTSIAGAHTTYSIDTTLNTPYLAISGEIVHSSIVVTPLFNGYKYWIAYTPFPGANSNYENPCVSASNDLKNWILPVGANNPLFEKPASGYNSDTNLVYDDINSRLILLYRARIGTTNKLYLSHSYDGVSWTNPQLIYTGVDGVGGDIASPSLMFDYSNNIWKIIGFKVDSSDPNPAVEIHTSTNNLYGSWSSPVVIPFADPPSGRQWWHGTIRLTKGGLYYGLAMDDAIPVGGGGLTYFVWSPDGTTFSKKYFTDVKGYQGSLHLDGNGAIISRTEFNGSGKYYLRIYKCAFENEYDHKYVNFIADKLLGKSATIWDTFTRVDGSLGTSESGQSWVVSAGTPRVSSNTAVGTSGGGNTRTWIDCGSFNHRAGIKFVNAIGQRWLIVGAANASNYVRIGSAGIDAYLTIQEIVADAATVVNTLLFTTYASYSLDVEKNGATFLVRMNGHVIYTWTTTAAAIKSGRLVGFQCSNETQAFDNFWCVSN